ncbi:MAG: 2-isopropylmalate synthase [Spirochaetaceae bacterium]|nr:MAG: 2-isopropylmalate synthase [Spirochaetaceae bacterium]
MPKYTPFKTVDLPDRSWPDKVIDKAPIWCSVDLRDGNQALAVPMSVRDKLEMFELLVEIGFKEIEVGFPSASQIDFDFVRKLIDENRIPDDVFIQVLTQSREPLIRRTFESVKGAANVIMHLYNSTSALQRKITFNLGKQEIKQIAIDGAQLVKSLVPTLEGTNVRFEYSPESFSDTETDYALEVCEAVMDVWAPTPENKIILNLPDTVEWIPAHKHADQIEWFCRNIKRRDLAIISLHTHNDRGTGVAACEMGMMAGAERVEGTLFGNGERTGNLDIVIVALNRLADGVDPGLDLHDIPRLRRIYERCTRMSVPARQPYAGELVFTAFSGSHQDAIKKGMDLRDENTAPDAAWEVPYLLIDPRDIGRTYESIVRINSQSGKGGVAYVMSRDYGFEMPKLMHPDMGAVVNRIADEQGRELTTTEIYEAFNREFLQIDKPLEVRRTIFNYVNNDDARSLSCRATVRYADSDQIIEGTGNGPISAFVHAMQAQGWGDFRLTDFHEHAIGQGAETEAVAYVQIELDDGRRCWGAGIDTNIDLAGTKALVSAYNRAHR